jgi:hypothetical protein
VAKRFVIGSVYEVGDFIMRRAQLKADALGPFDWSAG